MTQNRRIVLNIVATYGIPRAKRAAKQALCGVRSLYVLVIGLVCGWWTLMDSKTQTLPTPRLKQFPEGWLGGLTAVKMVKYTAKG